MKYTITVDGDVFEVEIGPGGRAWINREPYEVDLQHVGGNGSNESVGEYSLLLDHRSYEVHVAGSGNGHRWVTVGGRPYKTRLHRGQGLPANGGAAAEGEGCGPARGPAACVELRAPLPGLLVEMRVREGERVEEQQVVAVLESMKMNLEVRAPRDGVVRSLCVGPNQQVAQDEVLAVLGRNGKSDPKQSR